jgi:hypothetical protein
VLEHAHDSINAMQYELADIMFKTLSSAKEASLTENISADFNNWLSEKKTVINQQPNKMHNSAYVMRCMKFWKAGYLFQV